MRTPLRCTLLACLALACAHADAHAAEPEGFAVRVRVRAPSDCATEATFWSALSRRTDRLTRAPAASPTATIEVAITRAASGTTNGELRIVRAGQVSERRRLTAMTCGEVSDGLSLVAALAFDPSAKLLAAPVADDARTESAVPGAAVAAGSSASSPSSSVGSTDARGVAAAAPSGAAPADRQEARAASTARSWLLGVGGSAGGVTVGDPGTSMLYGGFAEIAWQRGLLAPSFRLGASYMAAETSAAAVRAGLSWTLGRASVCPLRVALARGLSLRPCAGAEVGALAASTRDQGVTTVRDKSRPWVAPSVAARLAWAPASWAFVEVQGSVATPLVRDEIVVDPALAVYQAPILFPSAEIGAGVSF